MPFARCETCGKRVEHCECPDTDEDDRDDVESVSNTKKPLLIPKGNNRS